MTFASTTAAFFPPPQPQINPVSKAIAARAREKVPVEVQLNAAGEHYRRKAQLREQRQEHRAMMLRDSSKVNARSEEIMHDKYLQTNETSSERLGWATRQIRERTRDEMSEELTFRPRVGAQGAEAEAAARADSQPRGRMNTSGLESTSRSRSFSASRSTRTQSTPPMRFSGGGSTVKHQRRDSSSKYMMQGSVDLLTAPARARTPNTTRYNNGSRGGGGGSRDGGQRGVAEDDLASLHSEHSTLFELAEDALGEADRDSHKYANGNGKGHGSGNAYGSQDEANNRSSSSSPFRQQQHQQRQQQQHYEDTTFYDKSTRWEVSSFHLIPNLTLTFGPCFASDNIPFLIFEPQMQRREKIEREQRKKQDAERQEMAVRHQSTHAPSSGSSQYRCDAPIQDRCDTCLLYFPS